MVKKEKKLLKLFIFSLILFIFYFILFPYTTEKEISVKPLIVHNLEQETTPSDILSEEELYSFKTGNFFGYLDKNGNVLFKDTVLYNVALSDYGFINYSSIQNENQTLVFMNPGGNYIQSFNLPGYPFFSDNGKRLFIIKIDATGFREVAYDGDEIWSAGFASIITSFSANEEYVVVGLLNGMIKVFSRSGECIYSYLSDESRLSVMYGTAISRNSRTITALSGIDPQNLLVFRKGSMNYNNPVKKEIIQEIRRAGYIDYTYKDKYLLFESGDGMNAMDMRSLHINILPEQNKLTCVDHHKNNQYITASYLLKDSYNKSILYIYKPENRIFIKKTCNIKIEFLRFIEKRLVIGLNRTLLFVDIRES